MTKYIRVPARDRDPLTSHLGADDVKVRGITQRHKLLRAYGRGDDLTADEAVDRTNIPRRACYWKRVSELLDQGLLEDTGRMRHGDAGSFQRVCVITDKGREVLEALNERAGS